MNPFYHWYWAIFCLMPCCLLAQSTTERSQYWGSEMMLQLSPADQLCAYTYRDAYYKGFKAGAAPNASAHQAAQALLETYRAQGGNTTDRTQEKIAHALGVTALLPLSATTAIPIADMDWPAFEKGMILGINQRGTMAKALPSFWPQARAAYLAHLQPAYEAQRATQQGASTLDPAQKAALLAEQQAFFKENKGRKGVMESQQINGLQYEVLADPEEKGRNNQSYIWATYTVTLLDKTPLPQLSGERVPVSMYYDAPWLTAALRDMGKGERRRVYIPYHLAYGTYPPAHLKLPFCAALIVELTYEEAATSSDYTQSQLARNQKDLDQLVQKGALKTLGEGMYYEVLQEGNGKVHPENEGDHLQVYYQGWTSQQTAKKGVQAPQSPKIQRFGDLYTDHQEQLRLLSPGAIYRFYTNKETQLFGELNAYHSIANGLYICTIELVQLDQATVVAERTKQDQKLLESYKSKYSFHNYFWGGIHPIQQQAGEGEEAQDRNFRAPSDVIGIRFNVSLLDGTPVKTTMSKDAIVYLPFNHLTDMYQSVGGFKAGTIYDYYCSPETYRTDAVWAPFIPAGAGMILRIEVVEVLKAPIEN